MVIFPVAAQLRKAMNNSLKDEVKALKMCLALEKKEREDEVKALKMCLALEKRRGRTR